MHWGRGCKEQASQTCNQEYNIRRSLGRYSMKKAVLKIFFNIHRKTSVNIPKFVRTPILNNICERLLLKHNYN